MSDCAYGRLAETMAILDVKLIDDVPSVTCHDPAAFYSKVVQEIAPGYEIEHAAKVCIEHQHAVNAMPGHWQSIRIRITA